MAPQSAPSTAIGTIAQLVSANVTKLGEIKEAVNKMIWPVLRIDVEMKGIVVLRVVTLLEESDKVV